MAAIDLNYRDPHLYPSQQVEVAASFLPDEYAHSKRAFARYIGETASGKAMVGMFYWGSGGRWYCEPLIVPFGAVTVSRRAADAPPLPSWAISD